MTFSVYEVELVSERDGQRLLQHVVAETPEEANQKAVKTHSAKLVSTSLWRPCTPKESAPLEEFKARQLKAAADSAASFIPENKVK